MRRSIRFNFRRRPGGILGVFGCFWSFAVFILFALCAVAVAALIFGAFRSSEVYKLAMAEVQSNDAAVAALGEPIKAGLFVSGSVQVSGSSGSADLSIPVSGPRDKGTLYAAGVKSDDGWSLTRLELVVEKYANRIDLLADR